MTAQRNKNSDRKFSTYRPVLDGAVLILSLLGILVVVHLYIQSGIGFNRGCFGFSDPATVTTSADCEAVVTSDAGKLFGVSNVTWGFFYYLILAGLSFSILFSGAKVIRQKKKLRALMVLVGVLYSGYLSYAQFYEIGEFCKLCLMSATIIFLIFITQLIDAFTVPKDDASPVQSGESLARARKAPVFLGLAALLVVLAGADLMYFNSLDDVETAPAETAIADFPDGTTTECIYDPEKPMVENYRQMVSASDPSKGNPDADVLIIEFFDPNCPHCKTMHPLMEALIAAHGDKARFVYRPFILWQHSVVQVEALHIAAGQGKFFEMLEGQFDRQRQEGLSVADLEEIADEIGLSKELLRSRLDTGLFRQVALRQRQNAMEAGVGGVPAVLLNGRFVDRSARTFDCLSQMIQEAAE